MGAVLRKGNSVNLQSGFQAIEETAFCFLRR
jgi:hypothetical protein